VAGFRIADIAQCPGDIAVPRRQSVQRRGDYFRGYFHSHPNTVAGHFIGNGESSRKIFDSADKHDADD